VGNFALSTQLDKIFLTIGLIIFIFFVNYLPLCGASTRWIRSEKPIADRGA
jgi:hypothetical protein